MSKSFFLVLTFLLSVPELTAQSIIRPVSRADVIQAQRMKKATQFRPEKPSSLEKYFSRIEDELTTGPIRFSVRNLGPGAGLTLGYMGEWSTWDDHLRSKLWAAGSIRTFYSFGTGVELAHVGGRDLSFGLEASHMDLPRVDYYGPGPDSSVNDRTTFRREDTLLDFRVRFSPHRTLESTCGAGQLFLNVGPGTNHKFPSTESVFGPAEAPGIDMQSNYLIAGCSAYFDRRDFPRDPHTGTYAEVSYDRYFAEDDDRFSFHRTVASVEQYIPFFNEKRVIAMRARTALSWHAADQVVPFYLQPTLGGDADLRGFNRWRFYDENSMVLNAEYRWQVNMGFDMALFFDAGKVFQRPGEISLSDLDTSAGFGFRFKSDRGLVVRVDTGFSREGTQVWFRFGRFFRSSY